MERFAYGRSGQRVHARSHDNVYIFKQRSKNVSLAINFLVFTVCILSLLVGWKLTGCVSGRFRFSHREQTPYARF
jgi:hypothetical protein